MICLFVCVVELGWRLKKRGVEFFVVGVGGGGGGEEYFGLKMSLGNNMMCGFL